MLRSLLTLTVLELGIGLAMAQLPPPSADEMDCSMLSRIPNAPMTVQTCEKRMAVQRELMRAIDTPGGERAGDERLSCEAITAELKTLRVRGVSPDRVAAGEAAGGEVTALMQRAMAQSAAMMGAQTLRSAGAAAVPGNAAGHAAAAANMAEQKALQDRVGAQMGPARDRLERENTDAMAELTQALRTNPRFARLVKLGMQKDCQS